MVNDVTGVSKNLELKLNLARHLAAQPIESAAQRLLAQQISLALQQSIGSLISSVSYTEKGEITLWVSNKPIEIGLAINNTEIGSPRPWALAKSLGHTGVGSLDDPYQNAIRQVESDFFERHGKAGIFNDSSRNDLVKSFTGLLVSWIGNPSFLNKGAVRAAASKWVGWGKCTVFITGKNGSDIKVLNLANVEFPSAVKVAQQSSNRLSLDFGIDETFTCRVHTDSKGWNSEKRLPIKLSFELN